MLEAYALNKGMTLVDLLDGDLLDDAIQLTIADASKRREHTRSVESSWQTTLYGHSCGSRRRMSSVKESPSNWTLWRSRTASDYRRMAQTTYCAISETNAARRGYKMDLVCRRWSWARWQTTNVPIPASREIGGLHGHYGLQDAPNEGCRGNHGAGKKSTIYRQYLRLATSRKATHDWTVTVRWRSNQALRMAGQYTFPIVD